MIIHGVDNTSVIKPLLLDANGYVIVSTSGITSTGSKILVDASGRIIVTPEHSDNLLPPSLHKDLTNLNLPAGLSNQDIYTVPASQYYRLTQDSLRYSGTVATVQLYLTIVRAGVANVVHNFQGLTTNIAVGSPLNIILEPADIVRCIINNATLNDDLYAVIFMERIK